MKPTPKSWKERFDKKFGSIHPDKSMPSGLETANTIKAFFSSELRSLLGEVRGISTDYRSEAQGCVLDYKNEIIALIKSKLE